MSKKIQITILIFATMVAYLPSLWGGFVFDDRVLMNSTVIQHGSPVRVITAGIKDILGSKYQNYWRPLAVLSVWLEFKIFGPRPLFFKIDQMLFHFLTALLLWKVLFRILSEKLTANKTLSENVAFLATLLWILHPSHCEVVATVSGRYDIFAAFFVLAAFWAFLLAEKQVNVRKQELLIALSGAFYLMGLLSKEAAAPLPVFIVTLLLFPTFSKEGILKTALFMFAIFLFFYFPIRQAILGDTGRIFRQNHFWGGLFNTPYLLAKYLQLLIVPYFPRPVYFLDIFTIALNLKTILAWWIFLPFAVLSAIAAFRRVPEGFGILWYLIFIAPVMGIFYVAGTIVAERFLYIPSMGFLMAFAHYFWRKYASMRTAKILMGTYLLSFAITDFWYINTAWTTQEKIAIYTMKHCPNTRVGYLLGAVEAIKNNEPARALQYLRAGISTFGKHDEEFCRPMAIAHTMLGDTDSAIYWYRCGLESSPKDPQFHNNLGVLLMNRGMLDSAKRHFEMALESDSLYLPAYKSMVRYYLAIGDTVRAQNLVEWLKNLVAEREKLQ